MRHVAHRDAQPVIGLAGHPHYLEDLRKAAYPGEEALLPLGAVIARLDLDEDDEVEAERTRVDQRDRLFDDPRGAKLLDSPPAGATVQDSAPIPTNVLQESPYQQLLAELLPTGSPLPCSFFQGPILGVGKHVCV